MYYVMMKTAVQPDLKLKTFCESKIHINMRKKEIHLFNIRFYQKLFIVLISLSTFLIFPESPKELENICEVHNSRKSCNVL